MKNLSKMSSEQLRDKLAKIVRVQERTDAFDNLMYDIDVELNRRNRAAIYKVACRVLKNRHFSNQFAAAAHYADAVVNGSDYFSSDDHHEIGSFYTKSGNPVIVDF